MKSSGVVTGRLYTREAWGEPKPAFKACTPPEAVSGSTYLNYLYNYILSYTRSIVNGVVSRYNVSKAQTNGLSQAHTNMT
jgi:hypothetical protein